jgi:hypothetical protein
MFFFILQTLFLSLLVFVIGWLLGRFFKKLFCKEANCIENPIEADQDVSLDIKDELTEKVSKPVLSTKDMDVGIQATMTEKVDDTILNIKNTTTNIRNKLTEKTDVKTTSAIMGVKSTTVEIQDKLTEKADDTAKKIRYRIPLSVSIFSLQQSNIRKLRWFRKFNYRTLHPHYNHFKKRTMRRRRK